MTTIPVDAVVYREDLYPRLKTDPALVQRYAEQLELLPPIEVNQHNKLIDGWHRWTAHRKVEAAQIAVTVTETRSDVELLALACERNAGHGWQLGDADKKAMACRLYADGTGLGKPEIAKRLRVTERSVNGYLTNVDQGIRERRREAILAMWLSCHTDKQIAEAVGVVETTVRTSTEETAVLEAFPKLRKVAEYAEDGWSPPLFDIWTVKANSNHKHYGNTAQEFVDNLLYTFTAPFDIVVDPFAGGGSTIDICKRRLRRYWVSDRKPIVEREAEIRLHDVMTDGVSGPARWAGVALVYLDPPYWKQAAGKYSDEPTDLANMPLAQFTDALVGLIHGYAAKLKTGAHVACIISPTQWPNEDKSVNYHDIDLACAVGRGLRLVRRVVCPYSTEQYNGTQVDIAKRDKLWMVLSRTMLVWKKM